MNLSLRQHRIILFLFHALNVSLVITIFCLLFKKLGHPQLQDNLIVQAMPDDSNPANDKYNALVGEDEGEVGYIYVITNDLLRMLKSF